jgi:ADP-ribose pyrophosphatase
MTDGMRARLSELAGDAPADVQADAAADAAADAHLRETQVSTAVAWRGNLLDVRRDVVLLPDGREATREYVVHPGAVMIVPLLDDQHVIMERQFRYPLHRVMLEMPAGKLDAGEAPQRCAERELREETGYTAHEWARAGILHNAIAYSTEGIEVWFARGLTLGARHLDAGEFLDVVTVSDADLAQGVQTGSITDAKSMVGLLYLQKWRSGAWPLTWLPALGA